MIVSQPSVSEQKVSWRSSALTNPAMYPTMHCAHTDPKVEKVRVAKLYFMFEVAFFISCM